MNPLRALHPAQRFQAMTILGTMWATIFCGAAGAWFWYGELVTLHLLVAAGLLVTGLTFAKAAPTETIEIVRFGAALEAAADRGFLIVLAVG